MTKSGHTITDAEDIVFEIGCVIMNLQHLADNVSLVDESAETY